MQRKTYPSDVSDDEWAFVAPYLTLMTEHAPQRLYELREVFNGLRYIARAGAPWRMMPNDLPPWHVVYQQMRRWLEAGVSPRLNHCHGFTRCCRASPMGANIRRLACYLQPTQQRQAQLISHGIAQ
jgi:transposase